MPRFGTPQGHLRTNERVERMSRPVLRLLALSASTIMLAVAPLLVSGSPASAQVPKASASPAVLEVQNQLHRDVTASPDSQSVFTVGVKCGWWSGTVEWGGIGIPGDPAWLQVTGTAYSSCHSTTYVHIKYTQGLFAKPYVLFAKTGPYSNSPADFYASSTVVGHYGNIWIQACSNRYGWNCASHQA
jgi:hypothetical protein